MQPGFITLIQLEYLNLLGRYDCQKDERIDISNILFSVSIRITFDSSRRLRSNFLRYGRRTRSFCEFNILFISLSLLFIRCQLLNFMTIHVITLCPKLTKLNIQISSTQRVLLLNTMYAFLVEEYPTKSPSSLLASKFPRSSFPLFRKKHLQSKGLRSAFQVSFFII